jgi:hypothetical protein
MRIRVSARSARGLSAAAIEKSIAEELAARLNPAGEYGATWLLGRTVSAIAVEGWLRRLPGIESIDQVQILDAGGNPIADAGLKFARNSLPKWLAVAGDISVSLGGGRS